MQLVHALTIIIGLSFSHVITICALHNQLPTNKVNGKASSKISSHSHMSRLVTCHLAMDLLIPIVVSKQSLRICHYMYVYLHMQPASGCPTMQNKLLILFLIFILLSYFKKNKNKLKPIMKNPLITTGRDSRQHVYLIFRVKKEVLRSCLLLEVLHQDGLFLCSIT